MLSSRREILGALAAAAALPGAPLGLPIGCQTYPLRDAIGKDFDAALRELAAAGFRGIEMCSPQGYAKSGYGALLGDKPAEVKRRIRAAGLTCDSCHYQLREFQPEALSATIAYAKELGLKQLVLASSGLRNARIGEWARVAQELNRAAEQIHMAGLVTAFHNHNIEFTQVDGELIYDRLLKEFDPKLVRLQFQTWVVSDGVDPVAQIEKHASRIVSLHLQDYDPATKGMTAIGKGSVDWPRLFAAARRAGVKNYYVEMDLPLMRESVAYLRGLKTA
ncbi:MAG: sugar phosphate isomerase/epimerase [Bryobacterales bacterium]|nr:sugar phosphate isomerase/epimerase [Bryobacterales bacterium]